MCRITSRGRQSSINTVVTVAFLPGPPWFQAQWYDGTVRYQDLVFSCVYLCQCMSSYGRLFLWD
uniref:Uncharacterized protein n=1 Tax=Anguilla anguilla TaxID=7936 RepID=A0A0E9XQ87_ANGAN